MLSGWCRASVAAYVAPALLIGPAALAQSSPAWIDPPAAVVPLERRAESVPLDAATSYRVPDGRIPREQLQPNAPLAANAQISATGLDALPASNSETEATSLSIPAERPTRLASMKDSHIDKKHAARDLAFDYLDRWSASNRVTLASAASFYGPSVQFHGRTRSLSSLLAEKRRFAQRWPERSYRYRPETTQISCEANGARCTVWSIFDYSAQNTRQGRRSRGIGTHEIVVSFAGNAPVIASENSRVLGRGGSRR